MGSVSSCPASNANALAPGRLSKSGGAQEKPHIFLTRDGEAWAKFTLRPVGVVINNGLAQSEPSRRVAELEPQLLQLWWEHAVTQGVKLEAAKQDKPGHKPEWPSRLCNRPSQPEPVAGWAGWERATYRRLWYSALDDSGLYRR